MAKCLFCGEDIKERLNICSNCGRKGFYEFSLSNLAEVYNIVTAGTNFFSSYFARFREETFPKKYRAGEANTKNVLLGEAFTIGYSVRVSEFLFSRLLYKDFKYDIEKEDAIMNVIKSENDKYVKLVKLMYVLNPEGEPIDRGEYSSKFLESLINSFLETKGKEMKMGLSDSSVIREQLIRAAAAGYYFKLAEEIIEKRS
jgi:hypothetical protein